jgi:hypothetical protein
MRHAAARTLGSPWLFGGLAAALILLLASASVPWPKTRFLAQLETGALRLTVMREATLELGMRSVGQGGLAIERAELQAGTGPDANTLEMGRTLSRPLLVSRAQISALRVGPGAEIAMFVDPAGRLEIRLHGPASADVVLAGAAEATDEAGRSYAVSFEESTVVTLRPRPGAAPMRMALRMDPTTPPIDVEGLYVSALTLTRDWPAAGAEAPFRAEVKSGKLRLVDVDREREIRAGEPLRFENVAAYLIALKIGPTALRIDMVGKAHRIVVGPPGYADDITPSALEHLVAQEPLKLLWAAGGLMLAVFWRARRWARASISER